MPMNECTNDAVRDVLPLLASGGQVASPADVEAHVAGCDACREELAVLRSARQALLRGPVVDVVRIAGAVPAYRSVPASDPKIVPIASRRPLRRSWRIAAAALIIVTGGTALVVRQAADDAPASSATAASGGLAGAQAPAIAPPPAAPAQGASSGAPVVATTAADTGSEMTFGGGLDDLSEDDLVALLAALDEAESLAPADPDEAFPGMDIEGEEEI